LTHLPAWLFNDYARLFNRFGEQLFTSREAESILRRSPSTLLAVLSQLKKRGYLTLFGRSGRTRLYRLIDPRDAVYAYEFLKNLNRIRSQAFLPIVVKTAKLLHQNYTDCLTSVCVYGSVARGTASETSDVDMLIVIEGLGGSVGRRLEELYAAIAPIEDERRFLSRNRVFTDLSFFPLSRNEASRFLPIYLDLIDEGIIVFDRKDFLNKILSQCRLLVVRTGGEKVATRGGWFWRLDPDMPVGERIAV